MTLLRHTGRWLALDIGSKTVGVAVSDPLKITARPLQTIQRSSLQTDCLAILELAAEYSVDRIIIGRPSHMNGNPSETMDVIQPLAEKLQELSGLAVCWQDERLSTRRADELMSRVKLPLQERRRRRNEFAAAVILEWYLEENT